MRTLSLSFIVCVIAFGGSHSAAAAPGFFIDEFSSGDFSRQESTFLPMYDQVAVPTGSFGGTRFIQTEGNGTVGTMTHGVSSNEARVLQSGATGGVVSTFFWSGGLLALPDSGFGTRHPENGDFIPFEPRLNLANEVDLLLWFRNFGDSPVEYSIFAYNGDFTVLNDHYTGTTGISQNFHRIPVSEVLSTIDPSAIGGIGVRFVVPEDSPDFTVFQLGTISIDDITREVPGEYPTIQDAIFDSDPGDIVAVAPGVYTGPGNRDIVLLSGVRVVGLGGRDATTIDCESSAGDPHQGFIFELSESKETVVEGFTIRNAHTVGSSPAALDGSPAKFGTISNCRIVDCQASGAVIARGRFDVDNCVFENNTANVVLDVSQLSVIRNVTMRNNAAGIVLSASGQIDIADCSIVGNSGLGLQFVEDIGGLVERVDVTGNGAGVYVEFGWGAPLVFRECTIAGHSQDAIHSEEIYGEANVRLERCVLWGNRSLGDPHPSSSWTLDCCIYPEGAADGRNFELEGPQIHDDPLFCDGRPREEAPTDAGDYSVRQDSPCLAENNPCGQQIGAFGFEGCGDPATTPPVESTPRLDPQIVFTCAVPVRKELRFRTPSFGSGSVAELIDLSGRIIETSVLVDSGSHEHIWRPGNAAYPMQSGVYFLRVRDEGGAEATRKFIWLGR